jgi:hypothetical protein
LYSVVQYVKEDGMQTGDIGCVVTFPDGAELDCQVKDVESWEAFLCDAVRVLGIASREEADRRWEEIRQTADSLLADEAAKVAGAIRASGMWPKGGRVVLSREVDWNVGRTKGAA